MVALFLPSLSHTALNIELKEITFCKMQQEGDRTGKTDGRSRNRLRIGRYRTEYTEDDE